MYRKLQRKFHQIGRRIGYRRAIVEVRISNIRHDTKACYVLEGHGGEPVEMWPIFGFYRTYISGEPALARAEWADWYLDQYEKYKSVPKSRGGMRLGSLDRFVTQYLYEYGSNGVEQQELLKRGINERVSSRLELADRILQDGFRADSGRPIEGREDGHGHVVLMEGHHRVAVLAAMGRVTIPEMLVWKKRFRSEDMEEKRQIQGTDQI